ncbi:MAG: hypothetical protein CL681_20040 [Blastopirellula sp.]|nr:hypothetical protein [Blastopirellula sp.]MAR12248.1 hypothetical protein [Blastopirellula sp.]
MRRNRGCNAADHLIARRGFLAGSMGATLALPNLVQAAGSPDVAGGHKRILQIYLQGGVSQFESWDPKPGTLHGGPFRAIETSVPGIHISELLPHTAKQMHHLSLVRSINLKTNDHGVGRKLMERGRRQEGYPYIGSVAAKYLGPKQNPLPGYIHISTRGLTDVTDAFLGPKYAQLKLEGVKPPSNIAKPEEMTEKDYARRDLFRVTVNNRFARRGQRSLVDVYNGAFDQAQQLMARRSLFETEAAAQDLQRYGDHFFARNCIFARSLLEHGATCVKITHHGYDTHAENFNFHLEQLGEFDRPFATLLTDLHDRGLLESTLVMVMSEFGRTPKVNRMYGRDHWGASLSIALGGCGIKPGVVVGKTNDTGTEVADREVDGGHLFHTYFRALGVDTTQTHDVPGSVIPIGDPAAAPIQELLA